MILKCADCGTFESNPEKGICFYCTGSLSVAETETITETLYQSKGAQLLRSVTNDLNPVWTPERGWNE